MSGRPALVFIAIGADVGRLRQALMLCRAEIALQGSARLFAQGESVSLFQAGLHLLEDERWQAAGEPALSDLIAEALADGVTIGLCQTSLAAAGLSADDLHPALGFAGPIGFLTEVGPGDRLLIV